MYTARLAFLRLCRAFLTSNTSLTRTTIYEDNNVQLGVTFTLTVDLAGCNDFAAAVHQAARVQDTVAVVART
jgi:hypothetical protein